DRALEIGAVGAYLGGEVGQRVRAPDGRYLMPENDLVLGPLLRQLAYVKKTLWLGPVDPLAAWDDAPLERPDFESVVASRDRLLEQQPELRVIGLALLGHADDLDRVARRLDRCPNLAIALDGVLVDLITHHETRAVR